MEAFHPILTPHFKLDWLTAPSIKATNQLRNQFGKNESIDQTVDYINRTMRHTMGQSEISWVIFDREKQIPIGWVTILNHVHPELNFHLLSPFDHPQYQDEIKQHLTGIIQALKINLNN